MNFICRILLPEDMVETNSLRGFIYEHVADQIKQVLVIISLTLLIILKKKIVIISDDQ